MTHMGKRKVAHRIFRAKPDGMWPLGNLDVEGDNVKMDLKEVGWEILDCTDLVQERDNWRLLRTR